MALDAAMNAALGAHTIRSFMAIRVELPDNLTINLITGSGFVTFPVDGVPTTFTSKDAIFGVLSSVSSITEAFATSAPHLAINFLPPTSDAIGALSAPLVQGSRVRAWAGLVNEETGLVIGQPERLWVGRVDTAKTTLDANNRVVEMDAASVFERLFASLESERLNKVWHRAFHPNESGLDYNIAALVDPMWGADAGKPQPSSGPVAGGGGSYGGGGGSGGGSGGGGGYGGGGGRYNDMIDTQLY